VLDAWFNKCRKGNEKIICARNLGHLFYVSILINKSKGKWNKYYLLVYLAGAEAIALLQRPFNK
jgi:hypothetical protein